MLLSSVFLFVIDSVVVTEVGVQDCGGAGDGDGDDDGSYDYVICVAGGDGDGKGVGQLRLMWHCLKLRLL